MDITEKFLTACANKTHVDGRLEGDGNWWAARIDGAIALVGWEVSLITGAAATILTDPAATFNAGGADLNGNTYHFKFDNDNMLDIA